MSFTIDCSCFDTECWHEVFKSCCNCCSCCCDRIESVDLVLVHPIPDLDNPGYYKLETITTSVPYCVSGECCGSNSFGCGRSAYRYTFPNDRWNYAYSPPPPHWEIIIEELTLAFSCISSETGGQWSWGWVICAIGANGTWGYPDCDETVLGPTIYGPFTFTIYLKYT